MDNLHNLCRSPWRNLVVLAYGTHNSREGTMKIINALVREFGQKLADLECLEAFPLDDDGHTWDDLNADAFEVQNIIAPKIRVARLPLRFLRDLRPILSNITHLEISVSTTIGHSTRYNDLMEYLQPHTGLLVNLTISDLTYSTATERTEQLRPLSFPRLRQLSVIVIVEGMLLDVLSAFKCPLLAELSFGMVYKFSERLAPHGCVSPALLHEMHPKLKTITILEDYMHYRSIQFFEDLAKQNVDGKWLFPNLEVIWFDQRAYGNVQIPLLKTLIRVVTARLSSAATASIRSIRIPLLLEAWPEAIDTAYVNTLNLLVPEAKISVAYEYSV